MSELPPIPENDSETRPGLMDLGPPPPWRDYLPQPKVVAAAVTVLLLTAVVGVVDWLGVDVIDAERVWSFIIGGGVATGAAYTKRG